MHRDADTTTHPAPAQKHTWRLTLSTAKRPKQPLTPAADRPKGYSGTNLKGVRVRRDCVRVPPPPDRLLDTPHLVRGHVPSCPVRDEPLAGCLGRHRTAHGRARHASPKRPGVHSGTTPPPPHGGRLAPPTSLPHPSCSCSATPREVRLGLRWRTCKPDPTTTTARPLPLPQRGTFECREGLRKRETLPRALRLAVPPANPGRRRLTPVGECSPPPPQGGRLDPMTDNASPLQGDRLGSSPTTSPVDIDPADVSAAARRCTPDFSGLQCYSNPPPPQGERTVPTHSDLADVSATFTAATAAIT